MAQLSRFILAVYALGIVACSSGGADSQQPLPTPPIARCMNLSNALEAPSEGEWGYRVRGQDLQTLAEAGFDTVRLPIKVSAYAGQAAPFAIDTALLDRLDVIVAQASAAGLQIIIDLHHYDEINEDPDSHIDRLDGMWRQLAAHFADAPANVIFEVLNEPHSEMDVARTDAVNTRILATIRETNPTRWVILGSAQWGSMDAWMQASPPRDDGRIISTFHYYDPYEFTHQLAPWTAQPLPERDWGSTRERATLTRHFKQAGQRARERGLPVLMGEFGVNREVPNRQRTLWTLYVRAAAEAQGFGWCHWGFGVDFRAYDLNSATWERGYLEALGLSGVQ